MVEPEEHGVAKDWSQESKILLEHASDPDTHNPDFDLPPRQLDCLVDPKNAHVLVELGGVENLAARLKTNIEDGLSNQDLADGSELFNSRTEYYGKNVLPQRKPKSLLQLMWIAFQDKVLIILSIAAVVSLALGLYETFGQPPEYDSEGRPMPKVDWVEGVAIIVAVIIVVAVGSVNDWQKERQFVKLNKKKEDRHVKAIRNGSPLEISVFDILVGDVLIAEPGELIPVDGVVLTSNGLKCDESAASGESDDLKKYTAETVEKLAASDVHLNPTNKRLDAFVLSGARVVEGTGTYLVIAVGPNSMHGRTMLSLQEDPDSTPLQEKLNNIAEGIAKAGILAALILFIALMIRFFVNLHHSKQTSSQKGEAFMNVLITSITIVVVAVPEGLPLAVTLALAFATTRMLKDNNLVRVLKACETMGSATAICSDKTGTLTQNRMTVIAGIFGSTPFYVDTQARQPPTSAETVDADDAASVQEAVREQSRIKISGDAPEVVLAKFPDNVKTLLLESIALNSTAFEAPPDVREAFVGSKTEVAMLTFAKDFLSLHDLKDYRKHADVVSVFPFDSRRKYMGTAIHESSASDQVTLLLKGASEVVLGKSHQYLDPINGNESVITPEVREKFNGRISDYASQSLRTIGIAYRSLSAQEFQAISQLPEEEAYAKLFTQCTFVGLVGIMDPLRPGVKRAVETCQKAGVTVRMVTGDNLTTAKAIAKDCGILTGQMIDEEPEIAMEGPDFRKLDIFEMKRIVPRLRVLARSSPQDKKKLVKYLKSCDEVVAVTGDGINDVPALKAADIGFSMGIAGTEVAKEASEIILMDDNFGSIVKAMMWGRTVSDAVKKFLQFQLTVNVTAVLLTFVSAVANSDNTSVLTAVQLLWVNLIMDTFAALALATDPPAPSVLERPPDSRKQGLITVTMWKMIFGQAILQLVITFVLHFAGHQIFFHGQPKLFGSQQEELNAMVFNTFVWLQFFNMFVNRRLDNRMNIFEGITKNFFFIGIMLIIGGFQVLIMFVGGAAFSIRRSTGAMWGTAIICGLASIPWAMFLRKIPDSFVSKLYPSWMESIVHKLTFTGSKVPGIHLVEGDDESAMGLPNYKWNYGIERVRDELEFIKRVKGGRVKALKFKPKDIYSNIKESLSPSSASEHSSSPVTTLGANMDHSGDYHTGVTSSSQDGDNRLLAVPQSSSTGLGIRSNSSHSLNSQVSSPTIGAFAMIPAIVGGAVAGWSPQLSEEQSQSQGQQHQK